MKIPERCNSSYAANPDGFRLPVIALATLILCSCRTWRPESESYSLTDEPTQYALAGGTADQAGTAPTAEKIRHSISSSENGRRTVAPVSYDSPALFNTQKEPSAATERRTPSNLQQNTPRDEFLFDGGDRERKVRVGSDWTVFGLDQEDTVIHFDTIQGETIVEASNREAIYAPRFAAVRKVHGVVSTKAHQRMAGYEVPTRLERHTETEFAAKLDQPLQIRRNVGTRNPNSLRDHTTSRTAMDSRNLATTRDQLKPFEDFNVIHTGEHLNSEKARLAVGMAAARAWMNSQALEVIAEDLTPIAVTNNRSLGMTYRYDLPHGKAKMRLIKLASKQNAHPGDVVEFTLRFDNLGDAVVGNVTIIDSLTTRLEYVEGSQECTLKAEFLTATNEGQSLVLRWEIVDPVEVGKGGVIRFKCRVR
ncbi:MAG: DUF11 domain-containing protein [Planctomycetota bacterium]|nr:DUF11 domain-containing protein [Planctomycetota bacterium]